MREEVLLGNKAAVPLKSAGDTLIIGGRPVRVSGILEETGSQDDFLIFSDLAFVQEIMKRPGVLIEVSAFCNTCPIEDIVQQISKVLPMQR